MTAEDDEVLLGLTVKTGQEQGDLKRHFLAIYVFRVGSFFKVLHLGDQVAVLILFFKTESERILKIFFDCHVLFLTDWLGSFT